MAFSKRGYPTLLLDNGEIVQYQHTQGRLERVRVSPDLDAEQAVRYAMAGFLAAGESIDPKHVKFGRSPEFQARMMPIWTREWRKIQQQEKQPVPGFVRKAARTNKSAAPRSRRESGVAPEPGTPDPAPEEKSLLDLPRAASRGHEPQP